MKAVILAAGVGTRLLPLTRELPKCLAIRLNGKTLLEHQLEALRASGVSDITLVTGHCANAIPDTHVKRILNERYATTNMLASLFCVEGELTGDVIVSYADIWFEAAIVRRLVESPHDIAIAVDRDWQARYVGRRDHPVEEAERVIIDSRQRAVRIGKLGRTEAEPGAEFIGMLRLTKQGCAQMTRAYHHAASRGPEIPFQRARRFEQAYLTDLMQELIDTGIPVHCEVVGSDWWEIDTLEDLEKFTTGCRPAEAAARRRDEDD